MRIAKEKRKNANEHFCTLKRHMKKCGYTQKSFAVDAGLSVSSISRIVRGIMWPDVYTAIHIAKLLDVDVTDIWHID